MRFVFLLAAGLAAGLYFFVRGFLVLRRYQVVANTPQTAIRGVAMGFVEVSGTARGSETVSSPVSNTPCFFYKVKIERWQKDSRGGGRWGAFSSDADGVRFYLEDETGHVLVDAQDSDLDLEEPYQTEVEPEFLPSEGEALGSPYIAPTVGSLYDYVRLVCAGGRSAAFQGSEPLLEYRVNPPRKKPRPRTTDGWFRTGDRYRLSEYCLVPDKRYTVAGTCVENARPRDTQERNLIVKGDDHSTFLISDESRADLQGTLGWQAAKFIFGGAALTVASAALILEAVGWLQVDFLARIFK